MGIDLISTFLLNFVEKKFSFHNKTLEMNQLDLRYTLATKVMRNGVEVIVATDRNSRPIEPEYLRLLSSTVTRPITLAPHTLINLMSMVLPTGHIIEGQSNFLSFLKPTFVTRTYYTIYNYPATTLKNNTISISKAETTVANVKTEQYSDLKSSEKIQPTATQSITFKTSPVLQTEIYHTSYTYLNTFLDGNQPVVVTSTQIISNTQVGIEGAFDELEPSELFPTTNTYFKTIDFTHTLTDGTDFQIVSTKDTVTQLVITDKPEKKIMIPVTTDVTKTYFVTYTYFSTYVDGDQTKVKSDVSVSSDVTIEKFYIKPKITETQVIDNIKITKSSLYKPPTEFSFNIFATKTYLTTFTYFTTLLQDLNSDKAEPIISSRTKVMENTVTETIRLQDLNTGDLMRLNSSLYKITGSLITTATLKKGDKIIITAQKNVPVINSYEKYQIKPTSTIEMETKTEMFKIPEISTLLDSKPIYSKSESFFSKSKTPILHKQKIKPSKTLNNQATAEAFKMAEEDTEFFEVTPTVTLTPASIISNTKLLSLTSASYSQSAIISSTPHIISSEKTKFLISEIPSMQQNSNEPIVTPSKEKLNVKHPTNPINVTNLLNLTSLGINGMNVLGPVFNAMAELIHNNLNTKGDIMLKRNDTISFKDTTHTIKKPADVSSNPLINFVNKFTPATGKSTLEAKVKVTTPRTPVYIPVGSFAQDSEFGESQDSHVVFANRPDNWQEKWKDTHPKNFEKIKSHDTPVTILEGGIPISPGQVITTNSDVIIGRPGESGPRPPTFALKNQVPVNMKPPPPPLQAVVRDENEDEFLGQHSTNKGMNSDHIKIGELSKTPSRAPFSPPRKHIYESHPYKTVRPHSSDRLKSPGHHKSSILNKHTRTEYDSGTMDLNPPPKPPPPVRSHDVHRPITINHEQEDKSNPYKAGIIPVPVPLPLPSSQINENYINAAELNPATLTLPTPQILDPSNKDVFHVISESTPNTEVVNPNILLIPTIPHIPLNFVAASTNPVVDRPVGNQLLVNIQPSQVANIVIPHGSSTALIVSGGKHHSLKGEVIDDPSPHPEPETVGFVGAEPVLKIENEDYNTSQQNEVVLAGIKENAEKNSPDTRVLFENRPQLTTELIKIRPKPNFSDANIPDKHSAQFASNEYFHQSQIGLDQFRYQSLPTSKVSYSGTPVNSVSNLENQQLGGNNFNLAKSTEIPIYLNHRIEGYGSSKGTHDFYLNQDQNVHNLRKENAHKVLDYQKYPKEGQNLHSPSTHVLNDNQFLALQNIPSGEFLTEHEKFGLSQFSGTDNFFLDRQKVSDKNKNFVKGGNGIYVDISPPGHLPPRPEINLLHEILSSGKYQSNVNENLSNHQSGVVQDVPLNVQIQLGSGTQNINSLKEILLNSNSHKYDNIYDAKDKFTGPIFSGSKNQIKKPVVNLPEILSPPPLPKERDQGSRPQQIPVHPIAPTQKVFIHSHPVNSASFNSPSVVPQIAEFIIPPPKTPPWYNPNSVPRPIPVGAGAPSQKYPSPRPEDLLILPQKNKPVNNYSNNIKQESLKETLNIYLDSDTNGGEDSFKNEYGEEIQESISRPLFPGQLPSELEYNKTLSENHKNIGNSKPKLDLLEGNKIKDAEIKKEALEPWKPDIYGDRETNENKGSEKQKSKVSSNLSHQSFFDQKQMFNTESEKDGANSNVNSFFIFGNKPSGFVTFNKDINTVNHQDSNLPVNHKGTSSFFNVKETGNVTNQKLETYHFNALKTSSGFTKINNYSINNQQSNDNIWLNGMSTNSIPSGFVKNKNRNENDQSNMENNGELHTEESNQGPSVFTNTVKNQNNKSSINFANNNIILNGNFNIRNKSTEATVNHKEDDGSQNNKFNKPVNLLQEPNRKAGPAQNKTLLWYNSTNFLKNSSNNEGLSSSIKTQQSFRRPQESFKKPSYEEIINSKLPQPENTHNTVNFDSNKISTSVNLATRGSGSSAALLFLKNGVKSNQELVKRPESFATSTKQEPKEVYESFFNVKEESPSIIQGTPKQPENLTKSSSTNLSVGFFSRNKTNFKTQPHNHFENQTIQLYKPKPSFEVNVTLNNAESDVNKWFESNFGNNGYSDKKTKPKLPIVPRQNITPTITQELPNDSDMKVTVLTPPKISNVNFKAEEVMGLSPPPLERPRRPQRPHRPHQPYKFEIPTTMKTSHPATAIENDFPPVRSPEFNRKPLQPQDIFPPRLPNNFVHHLPEFPVRNKIKPRPQERPVTNLPIDVPKKAVAGKLPDIYTSDLENDDEKDTYYAESEINGHSKPIINNEPELSFLESSSSGSSEFTSGNSKPAIEIKPSSFNHQIAAPETTEKTSIIVFSSKNSKFDIKKTGVITPTSTEAISVKTTYHTKVSASVTPTVTHFQTHWENEDIITGSEVAFETESNDNRITPTIQHNASKKHIITTLISTGSTTIFGDLYTVGLQKFPHKNIKPSTIFEGKKSEEKKNDFDYDSTFVNPTKTMKPLHTTTLTVTTTMTTVVHSIGHKPFTKTIVLTKTLISTVFNKVTETKTLVKPTTATIIQTHTIATTKTALVVPTALYPTQSKYPSGGTLKPEIFMADPHAKDTMTISVSSSMNKNQNGEQKRKPVSTRLDHSGKDSIIVVMSNNHADLSDDVDNGHINVETDDGNDIHDSRVVVGGVFDANDEKDYKETECAPACKAKKNELCQRIDGLMKCVCRPGFARMFPDRPCKPTYTYNVKLMLEKLGSEQITFDKKSAQAAPPNMAKLASATKEGLDRMIMQSDLRDIYHGVMVNGFQGKDKKTMVNFYVQLSENTNETKLMEIFKKTLQTSNYSLGGTELFAAREADNLNAEDFNECLNPKYHDCSENARCFNLKGTYTCSCKEGFTDLSENSLFPGRICSDQIGCEYCGYHGACYSKGEGQITCECFQWYSGERCHINLKVLLIALVTIGAILLALLLVCAVLTCCNKKSKSSTTSRTNGSSAGYLRYKGPSNHSLDRRAMIGDSSSESSVDNLPYICSPPPIPSTEAVKKKPVLRHVKGLAPRPAPLGGMEQRDRSVTVMIPRAKYRPVPPLSPHLTMSTFSPDKHLHKTAAQISSEQKLINYLDGNTRQEEKSNLVNSNTNKCGRQAAEQQKNYDYKQPTINSKESPELTKKHKEPKVFEYEYKVSNMLFTEETNSTDKRSSKSIDDRFRRHSDSTHLHSDNSNIRNLQLRKYSAGALVSAGYEVSAKVGMHLFEGGPPENEHLSFLNSHTMKSSRSQFTTLNRTGDHKTMSEARSYDETTVHPPTRSLKTHYSGSSPSSRVNNDEGHTMIERDLGSTFIIPESQLFKPEADRGSDISNFDSL